MGFLKGVYILSVGVFVVLFFALGIAAFYPEPKAPQFSPPSALKVVPPPPPATPTAQEEQAQEQYQQEYETERQAYMQARKGYSRILLLMASLLGLGTIALGFLLSARFEVIRSGLLLGGTATVLYGIIRSFGDLSDINRFLAVTIGLGVLLFLGYKRLSERKPPAAA